jgi:two-component system phosphate regulon sensor histidine kinase PhoR
MILPRPRTLLWQVGLTFLAIQAAAIVVLGWYFYARFDRFTHDQTLHELSRVTHLLSERYKPFIAANDPEALDRLVKSEGHAGTMRITIIDMDGRVLADSDALPSEMENHRTRPEVARAIEASAEAGDGEASTIRMSHTVGAELMYLAKVVIVDGKPRAVVRTSLGVTNIRAEARGMLLAIFTATAITLALTLSMILLVSRRLSGSIQRLAQGASKFAAGDLKHRLDRPASTELAALTDALNHMARQISAQIDLLQMQRNQQQAIYESMSNGLIALDRQHRILSVNRAAERLLAIDAGKARNRLLQELIREPELNRFLQSAFNGNIDNIAELTLHTPNDRTIQIVTEPLCDARDNPVGLLMLINDITQLRRLERIRSDFAANVSHELRTPITNIQGYVETLQEVGFQDQSQAKHFLAVIKSNSDRLNAIIEDLLALARLEQPETDQTLDRMTLPVKRLVQTVVGQFQSAADQKMIRFTVAIEGELLVNGNEQLLEQALGNLLSNAIKYSPEKTTITVDVRARSDSELEIAVQDQGPGIASEHLQRIFERFYRVDRARSREVGGTGLGLAIVKHIALVHGGRVEVQSELGHGSSFTLVLPRVKI